MSHTTTIGQIIFADVSALRQAAQELRERGIRCELLENAIPRAYYSNQSGMGEAPLVLKLDDSKYDVGFYPSAANPNELEARTDLYSGQVAGVLGVDAPREVSKEVASIGKLRAAYTKAAITNAAVTQGATVTSSGIQADGSQQVVVRSAA